MPIRRGSHPNAPALLILVGALTSTACGQADSKVRPQSAPTNVATSMPEPVRKLMLENGTLVAERRQLTERTDAVAVRKKETQDAISKLEEEWSRLQERANTPGMESYVGPLMNYQRRQLPLVATLKRTLRTTHEEANSAQVRFFNLEEQRSRLKNLDVCVAEFMDTSGVLQTGTDRAAVESEIRRTFSAQRDVVESLLVNYAKLWRSLTAVNILERHLLEKTEGFIRFIDERVLWLPSGSPLYKVSFPRRLTPSPDTWQVIGRALRNDVASRPIPYLSLLFAMAIWCALFPRVRIMLQTIPDLVGHAYTDSFGLTLKALVIAFYVTFPAFAVPMCASSWLSTAVPLYDADTYEFAQALSTALYLTAVSLSLLVFFRHIFRPRGIAEAHFGWDPHMVRVFRVNFTWFMWIGVPTAFAAHLTYNHPDETWNASVSRILFIFGMFLLGLFFARVFHPVRGAFPSPNLHRGPSRLLAPRQWLYLLSILAPLAFAAGAVFSYPHTAGELALRLYRSLWLLLGLMVVRSTLMRFVFVSQRRLAIEHARCQQHHGENVPGEAIVDSGLHIPEESPFSGESVTQETRTLVRWLMGLILLVGIWGIWHDLTPAFSFMNHVQLWSYSTGTGSSPAATQGTSQVGSVPAHGVVYLSDLVRALIAATATVVLVKHGPAIISIALLSRLPIDAAARFAISTVVRYVIVVVGVAVSFSAIGIGWSRVQWLAAGITVGLGFGLQEIFANFISGLIVLVERPVRIGDIVTVGGVDGTITRIRMRATTVTDFNRRELIVPNKEFITGQIVNWTLSDPVTRVVVPVGIAYGSDTRLARDLLLKTARECPHVMDDPAPAALFRSFGDSTLNFELRVFIPNRDVWPDMIHELHTRIDDEFRKAGIEIAFPQRDIHIRSVPKGLALVEPEPTPDFQVMPNRGSQNS